MNSSLRVLPVLSLSAPPPLADSALRCTKHPKRERSLLGSSGRVNLSKKLVLKFLAYLLDWPRDCSCGGPPNHRLKSHCPPRIHRRCHWHPGRNTSTSFKGVSGESATARKERESKTRSNGEDEETGAREARRRRPCTREGASSATTCNN